MFSPEQLQSATEVFQAMTIQTPPIRHVIKRHLNKPHSPVRKIQSFLSGREGEKRQHDQNHEENSRTTTMQIEEEEEDHNNTKIQQSSQPRRENEFVRCRAPISLRSSLFSIIILQEPIDKIKIPTCKYDGKTDHKDHISAYEGHMLLYTDKDYVWCKVFPSTLPGLAQTWFMSI